MRILLLIVALALAGCASERNYACEIGCEYDSTITLPATLGRCSTDTECEAMYGTEE